MVRISALILVLLCSGCAASVQGPRQHIRIDTLSSEGEIINDAHCIAKNDYPELAFTSGQEQVIRRSKEDLIITCEHPRTPYMQASALLISRASPWMLGNLLFGGIPGVAIDHFRNHGYDYPQWVQLQFGKNMVFDKWKDNQEGKPTPGTIPISTD